MVRREWRSSRLPTPTIHACGRCSKQECSPSGRRFPRCPGRLKERIDDRARLCHRQSGGGAGTRHEDDTAGARGVLDKSASPTFDTRAKKGDEARLATHAITQGSTTIVVVGGDGTTMHVANAIIYSGADVRLAILPAGTGNDFAKVLGTDKCNPALVAARSVVRGDTRVDVGKIESHYFLNCCGFGFDVAVLEGISRNKRLRGNAVYLYTALKELFGYRGIELAVGRGIFRASHAAGSRELGILRRNVQDRTWRPRRRWRARHDRNTRSTGRTPSLDACRRNEGRSPEVRRMPDGPGATVRAHLSVSSLLRDRWRAALRRIGPADYLLARPRYEFSPLPINPTRQ